MKISTDITPPWKNHGNKSGCRSSLSVWWCCMFRVAIKEPLFRILTELGAKTQWPIKNSYADCTFRRCFRNRMLFKSEKPSHKNTQSDSIELSVPSLCASIVQVNTIWIFNVIHVWQIVCCLKSMHGIMLRIIKMNQKPCWHHFEFTPEQWQPTAYR